MTALESLLNRERVVVASALSAPIILAWIYLLRGAGMGMTALAFFPHAEPERMIGMQMPAITWFTR